MISSKIFIKYAFLSIFALFPLTFIRGIEARAETFNSDTGTLTFEGSDAFKKVFNASRNDTYKQSTKEIIFKAPNFISLRGVGQTHGEDGTNYRDEFNGFGAFVNLEKVSFETLKAVGDSVFSGCKKLEEININSTLETVGAHTFSNCGLEKFDFSNITSIGKRAFINCEIKQLNFKNINSIGEEAFAGCEKLNEILGFGNITTIPKRAFASCGIKKLNFTNINSIGEEAFANCESLNEILDFGNITTIPRRAFVNCEIKQLNFKNINSIGEEAFANCESLKQILDFGNITIIPKRAFANCGFEEFNFKNIKSIGEEAFRNCQNLKQVIFEEFNIARGSNLFVGCGKLESVIFDNTSKIGRGLFLNCKSLKKVDLKGVQFIGTDAFRGCISLGSDNNAVNIPESVKYIGDRVFYGTGVETVEFKHNSNEGIAFGIEIIKSGKTKTNPNDKIIIKCYEDSYPMAYFKSYPDGVKDFTIEKLNNYT